MAIYFFDFKEVSSTEFTVSVSLPLISYANRLRQLLMTGLKTQAIHTVKPILNTSNIPNEVISHRLQLIPFKNDPSFSGTSSEKITASIQMRGPKNVLSGDILGPLEPVLDDLLIAVLDEEDELDMELEFETGSGLDHIKWSPCICVVYFQEGHYYRFSIEHHGMMDSMTLFSKAMELLRGEIRI